MDFKDKTALVCAHGLFIELAVRLARDFGRVVYWNPGQDATFPMAQQGEVGRGMEGIEVVHSWAGEHFDAADLIVCPDLYLGDLQVRWENMGKRVWGARNGENLEIYRGDCKKLMEAEGLPVQPWREVRGMKALRAHLKAHKDQHVKIDRYRGNFETFFAQDYDLVLPKLDEISHNLGPLQEELHFLVEDDLPDRVELGVDTYCIDGEYPTSTLTGIEVKDLGYVGEFMKWADIPEPLTRFTTRMAKHFAAAGYRGFMSNEIRIGADKEPFMIDLCARAGSPPNELYQEFYLNLSEILWQGADGILVDPEPIAKFGVQVIGKSSWAEANPQPVEIDPKWRRNVKLYNPVCIDGKFCVLPQEDNMAECLSVVGWGETIDEALEMVKDASEGVRAYGIKIPLGSADEAIEQMGKMAEIGLPVFSVEKSKVTT